MLLDRIFGIIAAVAFVFGAIGHVELFTGLQPEPKPFEPPLATFGISCMIAFAYVFMHVGPRDNLPYENGELDLLAMVGKLPAWAIVVSAILGVYAIGLVVISIFPSDTVNLMPSAFRAQPIIISVSAAFTAISFVMAAYCLLRTTPID